MSFDPSKEDIVATIKENFTHKTQGNNVSKFWMEHSVKDLANAVQYLVGEVESLKISNRGLQQSNKNLRRDLNNLKSRNRFNKTVRPNNA